MRVLDGERVMVRIFIGESDQWRGRPLSLALLEKLRQDGFAGATVFHGVAGFGARSVIHTSHILRLSEDLPVVIKIVDAPDRAEIALGIVEEMVQEGLITITDTHVVKYVHNAGR